MVAFSPIFAFSKMNAPSETLALFPIDRERSDHRSMTDLAAFGQLCPLVDNRSRAYIDDAFDYDSLTNGGSRAYHTARRKLHVWTNVNTWARLDTGSKPDRLSPIALVMCLFLVILEIGRLDFGGTNRVPRRASVRSR